MATEPEPGRRRRAPLLLLLAALMLGLLGFALVLTRALARTPGTEGLLTGLAGGLFAGLLVAGAGAWTAMLLIERAEPQGHAAVGDALLADMAPLLAELEATRADLVRRANRRALWRVPVGAIGGLLFWATDPVGTPTDMILMMGFGAALGFAWAVAPLAERYRRLYKERVLPVLVARHGSVAWRPAIALDPALFREARLFRQAGAAAAEDELFGEWRGLPIRLMDLELHHGGGDDRVIDFRGLLIIVDLPRGLRGKTAVVAADAAPAAVSEWVHGRDDERVRIEDPEFEVRYQVYGEDQVAARALLTPAFVERFKALGARLGHGWPQLLMQDNRLHLFLPRLGSKLFEPPGFRKPAASRAALVALHQEIGAALAVVDSVIDLDQAARTRAQ
jgi:hypothetical protein